MTEQLELFAHPPAYSGLVTKHPLHRVWWSMRARCEWPKHASFASYGGRGIFVCDEWRRSSAVFILWAINAGWQPGFHIDRIRNDGPYAPYNCRFVSCRDNQLNRRDTLRLSDGSSALIASNLRGICKTTFRARIRRGWSPDDAALLPLGSKRPSYVKGGVR